MSSGCAMATYLDLGEIRARLRKMGENGLANLVNDRMAAVENYLTPEEKKNAALALYEYAKVV